MHRPAGGDDQLVGGDDAVLGVAELPPPLVADHLDLEELALRRAVDVEDSLTVGTAIAARISAGMTVQTISMAVLPWTCLGSGSPGLPRKRKMA